MNFTLVVSRNVDWNIQYLIDLLYGQFKNKDVLLFLLSKPKTAFHIEHQKILANSFEIDDTPFDDINDVIIKISDFIFRKNAPFIIIDWIALIRYYPLHKNVAYLSKKVFEFTGKHNVPVLITNPIPQRSPDPECPIPFSWEERSYAAPIDIKELHLNFIDTKIYSDIHGLTKIDNQLTPYLITSWELQEKIQQAQLRIPSVIRRYRYTTSR